MLSGGQWGWVCTGSYLHSPTAELPFTQLLISHASPAGTRGAATGHPLMLQPKTLSLSSKCGL